MNREEYKKMYEDIMGNEDRNNTKWDFGQISMIMSMEKAIYDMVENNTGKKLLSIGCGDARLAFWFAKKGWDVVGIDASKTAIKWDNIVAKKYKLPARFDNVLIEEIENIGDFDVIEVSQTLEHVEDVDAVLEKISKIPVLIGSVPFEDCFKHDTTHIREFTLESLKELLQKYYKNVYVEKHSAIHDWDEPKVIIFKANN